LTRAELEDLARAAGGIRHIFAFGSPSFRKLEREAEQFSDAELIDLAVAEPRFLRRPLLVTDDGRVLAGGKAVSAA
jgi:arsenate reductase-like glutaredoxin family protein